MSGITPTTNAAPATAPATPMAQPPVEAPSATASGVTTPSAPEAVSAANPETYTVASGDTLWDLAHKFHTSVKKLKKLNHLRKNSLKPGQVLKIPPATGAAAAKSTSITHHSKKKALASTSTHHHTALRAQPVQDFDLPASTFASCPVPLPADEDSAEPAAPLPPAPAAKTAPRPAPSPELADETSPTGPIEPAIAVAPAPGPEHHQVPPPAPAPAPALAAAPRFSVQQAPVHHSFFDFFSSHPTATNWSVRFTEEAQALGNCGIRYDGEWCPPGESRSWAMDCSNTTRYLYKVTAGIQLPRTASDQYYYLHLQNKAWDVPLTSRGFADCNYLRENLKPGDLLFWENTYRPERQPPITHVMVYLGTNARGQWLMAGSQTGPGGEHNRRHGGPDIYIFNPTQPCGGYTTWFGLVHHQGRFCAFGRPLEADQAKLAVATND